MRRKLQFAVAAVWLAGAIASRGQLTAVVSPGYQFPLDGSVPPTYQLLNLLGQPTVTIYGTTAGSNFITPGSITGVSVADNFPDGVYLNWNSASPRQLTATPAAWAGWGTYGTSSNVMLDVDTNYFQLATNSIGSTNSTTTPVLGATTFPRFWLTLTPLSFTDTNISPTAAIQPFKTLLYSNMLPAGNSNDAGMMVGLSQSFQIVPGTNSHAGTNIVVPQLQMHTVTSPLYPLTSGNGQVASFAHGFSNAPVFIRWVLVCQTAQSGWLPGQEMTAPAEFHSQSTYYGYVWGGDSTNIYLTQAGVPDLINLTNGTAGSLNTADWEAKCYANFLK